MAIYKKNNSIDQLAHAYFFAKKRVINQGFAEEIDWQDSVDFSDINESKFLMEAAWVILASGMSDAVVSKCYSLISIAFCHWDIEKITKHRKKCKYRALQIFNNEKKIDAIIHIAAMIQEEGYSSVRKNIERLGVDYLQTLPFIGPATCYHLAKNIGFAVAKPDRHLLRISKIAGFNSPQQFCNTIAERISEKISVVDLVIWRYATLDKNYTYIFSHYLKRSLH